jgi:putative phosphoribosyl transferase
MQFRDRAEAGRILAGHLEAYRDREDVLVLGLARGGVPVAYEVAKELPAPLDVFVVRKLGVPGQEELAMGAIASGGARVLNRSVIEPLEIPDASIEAVTRLELPELERRERLYRGSRPAYDIKNRTIILVDDGLATGTSMRVAVAAVREHQPGRIVVAVPVAPADTCRQLRTEADEVVCAIAALEFWAVGMWYERFEQTSDDEVRAILQQSASRNRPKDAA